MTTKNFLGIPYPVRKNTQGFLYSQYGIDQIKSDVLVLLLTNPGERVMEPTFGTPLRKLLFEPNDATIQIQAKKMISDSIERWEPRIAVQQIDVSTIDEKSLNINDNKLEKDHILFIRILFIDPQNIKEVQELTLEVPLSGTGG
ncbi:MAG: GPW/gp25 family protein [bacterium]